MIESGISRRNDARLLLQMELISCSSETGSDVKRHIEDNLKQIDMSSVNNLFILVSIFYSIITFLFVIEVLFFNFL